MTYNNTVFASRTHLWWKVNVVSGDCFSTADFLDSSRLLRIGIRSIITSATERRSWVKMGCYDSVHPRERPLRLAGHETMDSLTYHKKKELDLISSN